MKKLTKKELNEISGAGELFLVLNSRKLTNIIPEIKPLGIVRPNNAPCAGPCECICGDPCGLCKK